MAGTRADIPRMVQTASAAAAIADNLKAVMTSLDSAMSGLSPMDGEIKNAFWQGHHNHLEAMDKLCAKLKGQSDPIVLQCLQQAKADLGDSCRKFLTEVGQLN